MTRPKLTECPEWYHGYINSVPDGNIIELMEEQLKEVAAILNSIPKEKELFRYDEGKWSIKELIGHINDAERILSYRALRFLRKDKTDVGQYDHDKYVKAAKFDNIDFEILKKEFRFLRKATLMIFQNVAEDQWMFEGVSDGKSFTLRAMAYIIVGHVNHHLTVLKDKYL